MVESDDPPTVTALAAMGTVKRPIVKKQRGEALGPGDKFDLTIQAEESDVPVDVRLRQFLKRLLRQLGFKLLSIERRHRP
jgi:hypothetical protein